MKSLKGKNLLVIGVMLFSLFFGAGNLIFPPFLGENAGVNTWIAMIGFCTTAVGFPILAVIAVAKSDGLQNLGKRINDQFALIYTTLIYLSIGPFLAIPRAGSLPFEMAVAPFLPQGLISPKIALLIYTVIFFSIAYTLASRPNKLVDRIAKFLTPILLVLLGAIFIGSFVKPFVGFGQPLGEYKNNALVKGFLEGYLTMDAIAGLNFGIVISLFIKDMGIESKDEIIKGTMKAGVIAGILFLTIYLSLAYVGALSGQLYGMTENGAQTLTNVVIHIFGTPGLIILATIFTIACLNTCVGLITSCSQYFTTIIPNLTYEMTIKIITIWSFIIANMGLTKILSISVPVLNSIYPIALVLIILALLERFIGKSKNIYSYSVLLTGIVSIIYVIQGFELNLLEKIKGIPFGVGNILNSLGVFIMNVLERLPLYESGLGWILPAIIGLVLGALLDRFISEKNMA